MSVNRTAAAKAIDSFLRAIGRNPDTERELAGTAERVASTYIDDLCDGYSVDVGALLSSNLLLREGVDAASDRDREAVEQNLSTEATNMQAVVCLRDLPVTTTCPHHLMPAVGTGTITFQPRHHLIGIGAVSQLLDAYAHRLTLQEDIGERVADALFSHLSPKWVVCKLHLSHTCVTARGKRAHGAEVETMAVRGVIDEATRRSLLAAGSR